MRSGGKMSGRSLNRGPELQGYAYKLNIMQHYLQMMQHKLDIV